MTLTERLLALVQSDDAPIIPLRRDEENLERLLIFAASLALNEAIDACDSAMSWTAAGFKIRALRDQLGAPTE